MIYIKKQSVLAMPPPKGNIYYFKNYEPTALLADGLPARKRLYIYFYIFISDIGFLFYRLILAFSSPEGNNFKIIYLPFRVISL